MLDLTDNIVGGVVVPPPQVVRHDGDDPYLVVAADKGTATFSDMANDLAAEYGFWLGDAFASGGSSGYDHKGMGITARGAWESVRRHFHVLGVDADTAPITVVGHRRHVGRRVRQRHAPQPGHAAGRGLRPPPRVRRPEPRPGGVVGGAQAAVRPPRLVVGRLRPRQDLRRRRRVAARRPRASPCRPRCSAALGTDAATLTPTELLSTILRGAGRPAVERRHRHVREGARRRPTPTSATGPTTACGWTAPTSAPGWWARAATSASPSSAGSSTPLGGGMINTDAIDNSAGVDCSDHEVNIKILRRRRGGRRRPHA